MIQAQEIKLSKLSPNKGQIEGVPTNPRRATKEQIEKLKKSIEETPTMLQLREIIAYDNNGELVIVGGNMRYQALKALGHKTALVKVLPADTPKETINAFIIKDNAQFGEWDTDLLAMEWDKELLSDWGVEIVWGEVMPEASKEAEEDDFSEEEAQQAPAIVKKGEIWQLGEHRLMCGDSTDLEQVKMLMGGVLADMVFTDPPYGMSAVSKSGVLSKKYKTDILNDEDNKVAIDCFKMCQILFKDCKQVWWGANYYTERCLPSAECWLVWDKNNGNNDQTDCELAWTNFRSVVRQFTMASEKKNRVHPTQKPIKLISQILYKFDKDYKVKVIIDLFGGSGSTMMACEQLNRKNYTMELDPHYCDVIIARWEKLTGKKAVKIKEAE